MPPAHGVGTAAPLSSPYEQRFLRKLSSSREIDPTQQIGPACAGQKRECCKHDDRRAAFRTRPIHSLHWQSTTRRILRDQSNLTNCCDKSVNISFRRDGTVRRALRVAIYSKCSVKFSRSGLPIARRGGGAFEHYGSMSKLGSSPLDRPHHLPISRSSPLLRQAFLVLRRINPCLPRSRLWRIRPNSVLYLGRHGRDLDSKSEVFEISLYKFVTDN
jgi:hypothetical protein